jgi:hypothetical protein
VLDHRTPMLVPYYSRTLSFRQGVGGTNDCYGSSYLYPLCTFCQCKPIYAHPIVGYSYGRVEKKSRSPLSRVVAYEAQVMSYSSMVK